MFKIGTALITGVLAAFFAVLSAISAGARFSTVAGRSVAVFLFVTALVLLVTFLLEKQFPALFAQVSEAEIPMQKEGKAPRAANDKDETEIPSDVEADGEQAEAQMENLGPDGDLEIMEEPAAAIPRGE